MPILFYCGAIFWTLGYDTIYGYQDIKDDEIIGLKSTSIKFKKKPQIFLLTCYLVLYLIIVLIGILNELNFMYYIFILIIGYHLFYHQLVRVNLNNSLSCLKCFKSNNFLGLIILISIIVGKF